MPNDRAAPPPDTQGPIGFLNGLDALFLYLESPETPMHIGSMHLFEVPEAERADFAARVRAHVASRLDRAVAFTRMLAPMPLGLANPAWVAAPEIDLDHHVRRIRLPAPGTRAQLHDAVASLHARLLDRSRPLWEMVVIEGLASGEVGFYAKVHHAGLDGQAGVALAQAVYDLTPEAARDAAPPAPAGRMRMAGDPPGLFRLAAAGARHNAGQLLALGARLPAIARSVVSAVAPSGGAAGGFRALLGGTDLLAPRTAINGMLSRSRAFASASIPLERVHALAERHEATVNDVVLAACGGALRDWLQSHGGIPDAPLLAAVPVSLRQRGDAQSNTQALMARMTLATDLADPGVRLLRIRDASTRIKGSLKSVKAAVPTDFPSIGLPWLGSVLWTIWSRAKLADRLPPLANVVVSNVPGPAVPLYLCGARMLGYWPVSIPTHGIGLNITVQSYAGSLDLGLIACRRRVPDIEALAAGVVTAFEAMEAASPSVTAARSAVGGRAERAPGGAAAARARAALARAAAASDASNGAPDMPEGAEVPRAPKVPRVPKQPEASKEPRVSKDAKAPKEPKEPKEPKALKRLKAFEEPEASGESKARRSPKVPKEIKALKRRKAPEAPKASEAPKAPEEPGAAVAPAVSEASEASEAPEAPEVTGISLFPETPALPESPEVPAAGVASEPAVHASRRREAA
jgi:diacylglycerol O-acyltransferase / wax synthase